MKKRQYIYPSVEVMQVNTLLMSLTGEASVLSGPGTGASAPKHRTKVF